MFLVKAFAYTNPGYYKWEIKKYGIKQPMKELKAPCLNPSKAFFIIPRVIIDRINKSLLAIIFRG